MASKKALPFDPIDEASRQWGRRWGAVEQMRAVTSLMRAQQIVIGELDEILRPHGLTFARYEALVLLTFSRRGSLPLGKMGERRQDRYDASRRREADFTTLSGMEVEPVYGPPEGVDDPRMERIGWPGEFPFTRGLYATGYRGRTWTIRQFSGFGNARQTNERYKMLLRAGGGGLSVAF